MNSFLATVGLVATIHYGPVDVPKPPADFHTVQGVKNAIIEHFGPNSPMLDVARCESTYRQYDDSGNVLLGIVNPKDRGIFQINAGYWLQYGLDHGWDIDTGEGNMLMADYLYHKYGLQPWAPSFPCMFRNSVVK